MAGLIVLRYQGDGDRSVLAVVGATGAALVVAQLADVIRPIARFDPEVERGLLAVVLGVVAGGAVGYLVLRSVVDFAGVRSALVGAAVAAVACLLAVGASFVGAHSVLNPRPAAALAAGPAGEPPTAVDDGVPVWAGVPRLRPMASALIVLALSSPAGYVMVNALSK
jgi:hypothetical protein